MASPLRLLLGTPKYNKLPLLSPLRKVKSCENVIRSIKRKSNHTAAKRLDFGECVKSNKKNDVNFQLTIPDIKVNDFCNIREHSKCFFINTPEKEKLLKCGLEKKNKCHVIGIGSFGTVIKANYKGITAAIKVTKSEMLSIIPEVNMLGLKHKNIIQTLDVIFKDNYNYYMIIMEYIENTVTLNAILKDITAKMAVRVALDISEGLLYLHQNNLLHLDVKPANVLFCADGVCKLCDFGSCLKVGKFEERKYIHKGTLLYTAPEILLGEMPTFKSDVYSLGILMWQLITKETPFSNINKSEVLIYKVVKYKLRPDVKKCAENAYTELFGECWQADALVRPEVCVVVEKLKEIQKPL